MSQLWVPEEGVNVTPQHSTLNSCAHVLISATSSLPDLTWCGRKFRVKGRAQKIKRTHTLVGSRDALQRQGSCVLSSDLTPTSTSPNVSTERCTYQHFSVKSVSTTAPTLSPQWHSCQQDLAAAACQWFQFAQTQRADPQTKGLCHQFSGVWVRSSSQTGGQDSGCLLSSPQQAVYGTGLPLLGSFHEEYRVDAYWHH